MIFSREFVRSSRVLRSTSTSLVGRSLSSTKNTPPPPPPPNLPSSSSNTDQSQNDVSVSTSTEQSSVPSTEVLVSKRAIAGLSSEYRDLLLKRAERGKSLPILYSNPGAYAQLNRLSDDVIAAIPPPPRPLYPMSEAQHTWRLAKGFSLGLVFVALAIYLYLKKTMRGNERFELERRFPLLAKLLESLHLIQDLSSIRQDTLDRKDLFRRIFARYSKIESISSLKDKKAESTVLPTLSMERAKYLLMMLLSLSTLGQDLSEISNNTDQNEFLELFVRAQTDSGTVDKLSLSCDDFLRLSDVLLHSIKSSALVSLASNELFGIVGLPLNSKSLEIIGAFFESVTSARSGDSYFSASDLLELCSDIGFSASQLAATEFIRDCAYLDQGTPIGNRVKVNKEQFIEFLLSAAQEAGINDDRIQGFLQTYTLLHLSGMKEAAGVKRSVVLS
jgi:hypothetical protein